MTKLTAIVTGGSSGIGEEICCYLLQANVTVVNLDIQSPQNVPNGDYHFEQVDLCNPEATRGKAAGIVRKFPVDCLVNSAGGHLNSRPLEGVTDEEFDHSINLHLRAALILAQAVVPGMKAGRFRRILSMSSRTILGKKSRTVLSGVNYLSGSVARNVSGFWGRYGRTHEPGALVTGDAEDEIRRGLYGLARQAVDAARGGRSVGGERAHVSAPDRAL